MPHETLFEDGVITIAFMRHGPTTYDMPCYGAVGNLLKPDEQLTFEGRSLMAHMRENTFRGIKPVIVMSSLFPRAYSSAQVLCPEQRIFTHSDLEFGSSDPWNSAFRKMPENATGEELYKTGPVLINRATQRLIARAQQLAHVMLPGFLAVCISHCPLVDTAYAIFEEDLNGVKKWLPGRVPYGGIVKADFYREGHTHTIQGVRYIPPPSI